MTLKVLNAGAWKDAVPKGVLVGTTWKTPTAVHVLDGGVWKKVWPADVAAPNYLYGCDNVSKGAWTVDFTVLDGWPAGDPNEAYMFRCSTMSGYDGYVGRSFSKTFIANAYGTLQCTLQDISGVAGKELKTISFTCAPRG